MEGLLKEVAFKVSHEGRIGDDQLRWEDSVPGRRTSCPKVLRREGTWYL